MRANFHSLLCQQFLLLPPPFARKAPLLSVGIRVGAAVLLALPLLGHSRDLSSLRAQGLLPNYGSQVFSLAERCVFLVVPSPALLLRGVLFVAAMGWKVG